MPRKANGEEQEGARSGQSASCGDMQKQSLISYWARNMATAATTVKANQLAACDSRKGMKTVRERGTRNVREGEIHKLADNVLSPMARTTKGRAAYCRGSYCGQYYRLASSRELLKRHREKM